MNTYVNKEEDAIVKHNDTTEYYLVPHHEDAFLTVQMENDAWGISDDHAGGFICAPIATKQKNGLRSSSLNTASSGWRLEQ
jgi:hypothetical protein